MNSPIFRIRLAESQEEQAIAKYFAFHANVTRMSSFMKVSNKESMTSFEPMIYDVLVSLKILYSLFQGTCL